VSCPPDSKPGLSVEITVPVGPSAPGGQPACRPVIPPDSPNVRRVTDPNTEVPLRTWLQFLKVFKEVSNFLLQLKEVSNFLLQFKEVSNYDNSRPKSATILWIQIIYDF
jgi:hypothetical protein